MRTDRGLALEVFALDDDELIAALTRSGGKRDAIRARHDRFDAAAARRAIAASGAGAACRHDGAYPRALLDVSGPPAVLHAAGPVSPASLDVASSVAIVGSRRASPYGLEMARALGRGLSAAGVTVVSGMAIGVDAAAHAGALDGGGRTVAVLGSATDVPYPASKRSLYRRIVAAGAVVSEMPPGFRAFRWSFPARNRIIAGLAAVTVVVEAAERSGALITARVAREIGRDVAALPGSVVCAQARGCNALIRDGAHLVTDPRDVLDLLFGAGSAVPAPAPSAVHLEPRLQAALDAVAAGRDTVTALAVTLGGASAAAVTLSELELLGRVRRVPGGRYVVAMP